MKRIFVLALVCFLALCSMGCQKMVTGDQFVLRSGETISGDMMISGGDTTLEQGSRVTGSLVVTGGSTTANGEIDGDVLMTGGSINFGPSAVVRGVLQKSGGGVRIAQGASVQYGNTIGLGSRGSASNNFVSAIITIPVLLAVTIVVFLMTRTSRGVVSSTVAEQVAPGNAAVPTERYVGFGGGMIWGIVLIGVGILFLFQEVLNVDVWHYAWPLLILAVGLLCFTAMAMSGRTDGRLAIPGSIFTMIGLILLYQNTFNQFQTWAYAWALIFPTAVGIGRYVEGRWASQPSLRDRGIQETRTGLVIFIVLAVFFELFINLSGLVGGNLGQFAFPALLILIGVLVLLNQFFHWTVPKPAMQMPTGTPPASGKPGPQSPP